MLQTSDPRTTPTFTNSSHAEESPNDDALPRVLRERTPTETVIDFDGNVTRLRTHKLIGGRTSRSCVTFTIHSTILASLVVLGAVMSVIAWFGNNSSGLGIWMSLLTFAVGAFLPAPKIKKARDTGQIHLQSLPHGSPSQ